MSWSERPFFGRHAVLATMHGKEEAIAPVFKRQLGLAILVSEGIDTDALGTFSGEIARDGTMGEVAIAKARLGMEATGLKIGLASEGTYGPHPQIPFVQAGMELLVLVDDERGLIVFESLVDETPCYDHVRAKPGDDISLFLDRIGFPDHALIVGPNEPAEAQGAIAKGIRERSHLSKAIAAAAKESRDGIALIQTDMRAHMNPTRMATLAHLAEKLIGRLQFACPACSAPGFGIVGVEEGLPCGWCGGPSVMVRHQIFACVVCDYREERPRPDGLTLADPGNCPVCNP